MCATTDWEERLYPTVVLEKVSGAENAIRELLSVTRVDTYTLLQGVASAEELEQKIRDWMDDDEARKDQARHMFASTEFSIIGLDARSSIRSHMIVCVVLETSGLCHARLAYIDYDERGVSRVSAPWSR